MLPIEFEKITPSDILKLIEDKVSERRVLEYKQALEISGQEQRAEFLADISSFANAAGGDLLFGIADERDEDGKATGIPERITPLAVDNPTAECLRLEQMIESGIQPRIPFVQIKSLEIPDQGTIILVRISKSWIAPHMVSFANRTRFYSRNGAGKKQLDVQEIGAAFALQRGLGERLRAWRTERIGRALAGEGPIPITGSQALLHFTSASALTNDEASLPRTFDTRKWGDASSLMSYNPHFNRYNADGFLLFMDDYKQSEKQSYLQVFRDGRLEYGDSYLMNSHYQEEIASALLEAAIEKTFKNAIRLLSILAVAEPFFVSLSLLGVKGRRMALPGAGAYPPFSNLRAVFDRDVIACPDVRIENLTEGPPFPTTLLPIVNSMWQAAGLEKSPYIREDGSWIPGGS